MKKTFTLKPMVFVRMLAEVSVLVILLAMPFATLIVPALQKLPVMHKLAFYALAGIALLVLPCYGFVTWRVKLDDKGLAAVSLFKRQFAEWNKMEKLSFKSSWNWRRYVVGYEGGELTFPIWLANVKELVGLIRDRLPGKGTAGGATGPRVFKQDLGGLAMQLFRVALGIFFIVVFWLFFASLRSGKGMSQADYILVMAVCIAATVLVGWRCFVIALMPRSLELTDSELVVSTCFFERRLPWREVLGVSPSFFMLPEGLMLKTKGGTYLLTEELEDVDELESVVKARLSRG